MVSFRARISISVCLIAMGISTILSGCTDSKQVDSKDLEVVEQADSVIATIDDENFSAHFTLDVPVKGPQVLIDSVLALVNYELYNSLEESAHFDEDVVLFTREEMFSKDGEQLLKSYMDKYGPILKDSLWRVYDFKLKMEAQTESYVTYGLEHFHCGGSCGSEKYYYTFDKSDGHQVKEIITPENIASFMKDNPDFATNKEFEWEFDAENEFEDQNYGLLDNTLSLVISGHGNHFFLVDIPFDKISSYLSQEAQTLLGK